MKDLHVNNNNKGIQRERERHGKEAKRVLQPQNTQKKMQCT